MNDSHPTCITFIQGQPFNETTVTTCTTHCFAYVNQMLGIVDSLNFKFGCLKRVGFDIIISYWGAADHYVHGICFIEVVNFLVQH